MLNTAQKLVILLSYCFFMAHIQASCELETVQRSDLIVKAYSIPTGSCRRCLASSDSFFTMSSPSNTQHFTYNRKNHYGAQCARNNHGDQNYITAAAIIADSKLITAQQYCDGLWIDTLDHNALEQHCALPHCPAINTNCAVKRLSGLPYQPTSLLVSLPTGNHLLMDLQEEKKTEISFNVYIAHAIPDRTGNGIWYRTLEESGYILADGSPHFNNCIGHYDIRSGKASALTMLPNGIKEMHLNKVGDRYIVTTWNHQHLIFDVGPSLKGLISTKQLSSPSNHTCMVNDKTVVYNNSASHGEQTLNWYTLEKDVTTACLLSNVIDETDYLENTQLLVGYEDNSSVRVYEFSGE